MEDTSQNNHKEQGLSAGIVFGHNHHFAFIYKKTEKLVTAVYMITNFIKDNEPLKWRIRENALSLMEINIDCNSVSLTERRDLLKEFQSVALEIVSFSSIAYHAGIISEMNFHILSREFNNLISLIGKGENRQANEQTVMLDPGFFDTEEPPAFKTATVSTEPHISKGQVSRTSSNPVMESLSPRVSTAPKDNRKTSIIKLLSKKNGLNIKDFSESIKGCSAKTIQRELLAMVASGVLKKEGDRRWSTYSLAR